MKGTDALTNDGKFFLAKQWHCMFRKIYYRFCTWMFKRNHLAVREMHDQNTLMMETSQCSQLTMLKKH